MFGSRLSKYQRKYDSGDLIFREGDWGDSIFVIKEGEVEVRKFSGGDERRIASISDREIIGEMILTGEVEKRSATVRAKTEVVGWDFNESQFESLIQKDQRFRQKIMSSLTQRLYETTDKLAEYREKDEMIFSISKILLGIIDHALWDSEEQTVVTLDETVDMLAYRFETSVEAMNDYLRQTEFESVSEMDYDRYSRILAISQRILDEADKMLDLKVSTQHKNSDSETIKSKMVNGLRTAENDLKIITNNDSSFDREKLQTINENLSVNKDILEKYRELSNRSSILEEQMESMLDEIESQLDDIELTDTE